MRTVMLAAALAFTIAPGAMAQTTDQAFAAGLKDRTSWEFWISDLAGDAAAGALYWAGQRSLPNPGQCLGSAEFVQACTEAKSRLALPDVRRKTEPAYRLGWNSFKELPKDETATPRATAVPSPAPTAPNSPQRPQILFTAGAATDYSGCKVGVILENKTEVNISDLFAEVEIIDGNRSEIRPLIWQFIDSGNIREAFTSLSGFCRYPVSVTFRRVSICRMAGDYISDCESIFSKGSASIGPQWRRSDVNFRVTD